jgi:hypothetical protein
VRLNVITDEAGNLVAATQGPVVESEQIAAEPDAEGDGGGVVLIPGQTVRQSDVPENLFNEESLVELGKYLLST